MKTINEKLEQEFIEEALVTALGRSCSSEYYIVRTRVNPFDQLNKYKISWEDGFIAKVKKDPTGKNHFDCKEKHILVFNEVDIEWIKTIEKINLLHNEPKIFWWFTAKNSKLKDKLLDLIGEFRTIKISDDVKPKVTFFLETKVKELFHDFDQ